MDTLLIEKLKSRTQTNQKGCWEWLGAKNSAGYGNTYLRGKYVNAHKAMWIALHGSPATGEFVLHRCDNPCCVNPSHLFLGSQNDNMQDKSQKGRAIAGPCSNPSWWTDERRKERAEQTRERMRVEHALRADEACVPREWKFCPSCRSWFPRDQFYKNSARPDGLKPHCKRCSVAFDVARRKSHQRP